LRNASTFWDCAFGPLGLTVAAARCSRAGDTFQRCPSSVTRLTVFLLYRTSIPVIRGPCSAWTLTRWPTLNSSIEVCARSWANICRRATMRWLRSMSSDSVNRSRSIFMAGAAADQRLIASVPGTPGRPRPRATGQLWAAPRVVSRCVNRSAS